MANILLISCNLTQAPYPVYPLGLTMIAETARIMGHQVRLWDLLVDGQDPGQLAALLGETSPDVIGLSLRNVDNVNATEPVSYITHCRELVRTIRATSSAPIVLGGSGFSLFPEPILAQVEADYGIVGEGEVAFCRLVDQIHCGQLPEGKIVRAYTLMTGHEIDAPARDSHLAEYYLAAGGMLNVQAKRGCPFHCAYCAYPLLEGNQYRFRPAGAVVDEIEMLRDQYGADYFAFTDSAFNDSQEHYLTIAEELVRRNVRIPWMAFFRPQRFKQEDVALLRRAGLACVEWGTDCSTDQTLASMGKSFLWNEVELSTRLFHSAGISNTHYLIFGGPGETEQTLREGLHNIELLAPSVVLAYCGVRIMPRTAIRERAIEEGQITAEDNLLEPKFYFSPATGKELLDRAIRESFGSRIDRIYPPEKDQDKVKAFHQLGYRGPIWDLLLAKGTTRSRRVHG